MELVNGNPVFSSNQNPCSPSTGGVVWTYGDSSEGERALPASLIKQAHPKPVHRPRGLALIQHFEMSVGLTAWKVADKSGAEGLVTEPLCWQSPSKMAVSTRRPVGIPDHLHHFR